MYEGKSVSVVFSTYREKRSIKKVVDDYYRTGFVDEIVVVNNNASMGTDEEVKKTNAWKDKIVKLLHEERQGYGFGFRRAIREATCDYIVVSEPDGTFLASDLERFLVYSRDFDVVLGTRTSQIGSLSGEGMGILRKFANVIEAKTIELLFNSVALTDVGCTYKLFKRRAIELMSPYWSERGSALFNTELLLNTVTSGLKFVEIPITYNKRVGKSFVVGSWYKIVRWAIVIQIFIFYFWLMEKIGFRKYRR